MLKPKLARPLGYGKFTFHGFVCVTIAGNRIQRTGVFRVSGPITAIAFRYQRR